MDQVFAVRLVCEKYLANGKAFVDLILSIKRHMILSIYMVCGSC